MLHGRHFTKFLTLLNIPKHCALNKFGFYFGCVTYSTSDLTGNYGGAAADKPIRNNIFFICGI